MSSFKSKPNSTHHPAVEITRRHFFGKTAQGIGVAALAALLNQDSFQASTRASSNGGSLLNPNAIPHFPAKAKRVIFLFQSGGPSQLDLFDPKPDLAKRQAEDLPASIRMGQRLTTMTAGQTSFPVASSKYKFIPSGVSGTEISEMLPYTQQIADDICLVRSMTTDAINHDPAITFFQTGFQIAGRPSMGSWLSYGLGSENKDLPGFVAMVSGNGGQPLYDRLWGSGFLPSRYQGVKFRSKGDPILYLSNPDGHNSSDRREALDLLRDLNQTHFEESLDPEIQTRISQYELAYRMQTSVPELTDFTKEPESTFNLYGEEARKPGTFAYNCLMARRLAERGVRFIQLFQRGWDHHSGLPNRISSLCKATDQPSAGLIQDLKQRGMLEDTLVVWAGEFGRTVYCQGALSRENYGRDHHPRCFSIWLAGGGIRGGQVYGQTDEFSYNVVENPVSAHDLHATMLHLLGINHEQLTYPYQGRNFRLTDVHGKIIQPWIA